MKIFKIQFETRFTSIINFSDQYRDIVAPYLKLCDYNITNQNTHQEVLTMIFKDSNYHYDIRWDRIIFVSEGNRKDLLDSQGPLFNYFNILNALSKTNNFGVIKNALLQESALIEYDYELDELNKKFYEEFLTLNVPREFKSFTPDYSITSFFEKEKKEFRIQFGPFNNKTDIERFQLSPINKKRKEEYNDYKGIIAISTYVEPLTTSNSSVFKNFDNVIRGVRETIRLKQ